MYNQNYSDRAIPLVAVNEKTGSTYLFKNQNIKWLMML
jgi:hypothetical protein